MPLPDKNYFFELVPRYKLPIAVTMVGVIFIALGFFISLSGKPKEYPVESIVSQPEITVDVSGAVEKPGVYRLNDGARVEDGIKAAGGLSSQANQEYLSKYINMAQRLTDGSKLYLPFAGEPVPVGTGQGTIAGAGQPAKLNINTATQSELEALPGIGPVTTAKIISGRPYQQAEDLVRQKIISQSLFGKIKDLLAVY